MKDIKEFINEATIISPTIKKYKKDIEKFLSDYDWDKVVVEDVVDEFEYGDEYYMVVYDILNHLGIEDEGDPAYEDIYYGVGPIIRTFLKKNKMWK
jgi:hypothetical protein